MKKEKLSVSDQEALYARVQKEVEAVQRKAHLTGAESMPAERLSTGLLMMDLQTGGGLMPGCWYSPSGAESSGKTTFTLQCLIAAVSAEFEGTRYYDYEGSTGSDTSYISSLMRVNGLKMSVSELLGVRKDGKVLQKGKIWYSPMTVLEEFFEVEGRLLRRYPDKLYLNGKWWLCFEDDKYGREIIAGRHDKNIKAQYGKLAIPAKDGRGQGLIIVDSFAAMNPRALDDDENTKQGMSLVARVFAEKYRLIRGRMMPKRVMLIGTNQLREKPGVMYGDPNYEPGGNAIKFASDCRLRFVPRSVQGGSGQFEEEQDYTGEGTDVYRWVHARAIKNKVGGPPNLEGWYRIWVRDSKGRGNGFDPVMDTYQYLVVTGQISGSRKKRLTINNSPLFPAKKAFTWRQFKTLILGTKEEVAKTLLELKVIKKGDKPFKLRDRLFKQLREGDGFARFFKTLSSKQVDDED